MIPVAIIGLGAAARNLHLPAYAQLGEKIQLVGGCDPSHAAREFASKKWRLRVFANPIEMIERTRPEAVVICTPPQMHREHLQIALNCGCHVFCEKPLAEDFPQAFEMAQASEQAGRIVVVNNQFPYMRIHQAAKHAIGSKAFGELLYLHAWHTMTTNEVTEAGWRGGLRRRLCFEFGVHVFELVRFFFEQNPVRILAHMPNPGGRAKCDVINVIMLEFADGRGACISLDRVSRGPEHYLDMRLDGESAIVHTSIGGRVAMEAGMNTRTRRPFLHFRFAKGGQAVLQNGNRSKVVATDGINPFASATACHFENFLQAIQNGHTPRGHIKDNLHTLALVMAAYESAGSGEWIDMAQYERSQLALA
jgi:predicted dehydrogenase